MPRADFRFSRRLWKSALALLLLCNLTSVGAAVDLAAMSETISNGIGRAKTYPGDVGSTIVIFEEQHDSFTMTLEESVGLIRLFAKYGMKDIGLEGYTDTDKRWTKEFSPNPAAALALLKKGEISSAAFMALAYGVNVHPIEKSSEYLLDDNDISEAVSQYISKIARYSLKQTLTNKTVPADVLDRLSKLSAQKDFIGLERLIVSQDAFANDALARLQKIDTLEMEDAKAEIVLLESIVNRASALNLDIEPRFAKIINDQIVFDKARWAASKTMANGLAQIANDPKAAVGMIIGAYHTRDVVSVFVEQKRPVIVITPNSAPPGGQPAKYSKSQFADLYRGEPIERDDITVILRGLEKTKPKTPFNARWLQSKSEIYDKVDGLVTAVFGGGSGDPPRPPIDWTTLPADSPEFKGLLLAIPDGKFHGKLISIDRSRTELMRDGDTISLVFPIKILSAEGLPLKEIWGKASPASQIHAPSTDEVVSSIMEVINSAKPPSSEATKTDEVEISKVAVLTLAETKEVLVQVKKSIEK